MIQKKSHKLARKDKDRMKRKAVKDSHYRLKIKRAEQPQREKKVIVRQELVKDPKTGKSEYKDVYEVKDIPNLRLDKKLSKTLYIPHAPPPRVVKYLRPVKAHHISLEKKYPEPKAKFGDLEAYKKSRILDIAQKVYDLPEKKAKKFDKDDLIQFINDTYKERKIKPEKYTKTKIK